MKGNVWLTPGTSLYHWAKVLALVIPALQGLFKFAVPERIGTIILSALVAHTGWHWMIERGEQLSRFQFLWPGFTAATVAGSSFERSNASAMPLRMTS